MVFDDAQLDGVQCPNGHPLKVTMAQARRSATIRCARCDGTTKIDGRQADRNLREVDRAFDDLKKTVKNFGR